MMTLLCAVVSTLWGQEVTYDFTENGWEVTNGALTNGTVSFPGEGPDNFKMNSGYFILGKSGAYLTFPTYNFNVERIEIVGTNGASPNVKQNIFVGDVAVSTETTGAKNVTNTYYIDANYQSPGNQYTLKVTNGYNTQISAIKIYKKNVSGPVDPTIILNVTDIMVGETTRINFPSNLTNVSFESDNEDVASVSDNGVITAVGGGEATITVMWDGDDNYNEGETEFTVTVLKHNAIVTLATTTLKVGSTVAFSYPEDLYSIVFDSEDEEVATVDENGVITGVGVGQATINVEWGDNKYNEGMTAYTITVIENNSGMVFVKVKDSSQLVAGNEYLIVSSKNNNSFAMGTKMESSTAAWAVEVPEYEDEVEITNDEVVVLTLGGTTDAWTFTTNDDMGDICITSDGNRLDYTSLKNLTDEKMRLWTITSDFQIKSNMYGNRFIQYNSGGTRFACYNNTQTQAFLYVKEGSSTSDKKYASLEIERTTLTIPGVGINETTIYSVPEDLVFTLSSSDENYATVSGNKITALKAGNVTITATWDEQTVGDFVYEGGELTFDITIIEPEDGYFDFTNLVLDYGSDVTPTTNSNEYVEEETTWTAGNVTLVVDGKYRWWLADGTLRIYNPTNNSTTLTFTTRPNCMITKIEVSGSNRSSLASEDELYNDNDGTWEGYASQVVLYRDGSNAPQIKTIKVTYEEQPFPFTLDIFPEASDGIYYYSTMSNIGPGNYMVPSNLMVSTIIINEERRIENTQVFTEGESFPGNGAYLVTANFPGLFTFEVSEITEPIELLSENMLYPAIKGEYTSGPEQDVEYNYYKLTLNSQSEMNSIGFYWGASDGEAFVFKSDNKAFMAIPKTDEVSHASGILFDGSDVNDISRINSDIHQNGSAYTLTGIRMEGSALPKGVYILNGNKMVVK